MVIHLLLMEVLFLPSTCEMTNFLNNKNVVLINSNKYNSGNLISYFNAYGSIVHHASVSKKNLLTKIKKNYTTYQYKNFSNLSKYFSSDLKAKKIDIYIFFLQENNILDEIKSKKKLFSTYTNDIIELSRNIIKKLKKNNHSKIINILLPKSFISEKNGYLFEVLNSSIIGYSKSLAKNLGKNKILVNSISPGYLLDKKNNMIKTKDRNFKKAIPLKRLANFDDINSSILFLSSDLNTYMTGQILDVDGGLNAI